MILATRRRRAVLPHEARDLSRVVLHESLRLPRRLVDRRRRRRARRRRTRRTRACVTGIRSIRNAGSCRDVAILLALEPLLLARGVLARRRLDSRRTRPSRSSGVEPAMYCPAGIAPSALRGERQRRGRRLRMLRSGGDEHTRRARRRRDASSTGFLSSSAPRSPAAMMRASSGRYSGSAASARRIERRARDRGSQPRDRARCDPAACARARGLRADRSTITDENTALPAAPRSTRCREHEAAIGRPHRARSRR